ncbi:MAG TPA: hypothetical protein VHT28_14710 [Silvibacterium sp.]|nr:hypothetical protein [Silvibacterium sp.]
MQKLSVFQIELELSTLPEFTSTWSAPQLSDVRQLTPANEFSSQATALLDQIRNDYGSDYAVVDLGTGQQWLTSRLFIFAILLRRMRDHGALDSWQATQLVQGFLKQIQQVAPPLTDAAEWVSIPTQQLWEHAKWLDGSRLERVFAQLHRDVVDARIP